MYTRKIYHNRESIIQPDSHVLRLIAEKTFFPEGHLHLAVSGGADSAAMVCLAHYLGKDATVHHVNHGTRLEATAEAKKVEQLAARFGFGFELYETHIEGSNYEEKARNARKILMPENVLTAHTKNDKVETIMMNMMRGASTKGMSSMNNKPLLALTTEELDQICVYYHIYPNVDETNFTEEHTRNRVRHELIPLMEDISTSEVTNVIERNAQIMKEESDYMDSLAAEIDLTDCATAKTKNVVLLRRAARIWIETNIGHKYSEKNIINLVEVVQGTSKGTQIAGHTIKRTNQKLHIL